MSHGGGIYGVMRSKLATMGLLLVATLPLTGCLGAVAAIAIQAAVQTTVQTTANVVAAGVAADQAREYVSLGFTANRPDATRPPAEAVAWLDSHRSEFRDELDEYNQRHDLAQGPSEFGGMVSDVRSIDWIRVTDARLDYLEAEIGYNVGTRDQAFATRTFVLRWQGDWIQIVDHLDGTVTLASYLGLPPSPPEPVAAATAGATITPATTPLPGTQAAKELEQARGAFNAWYAEHGDSLERALGEVVKTNKLLDGCAKLASVPVTIEKVQVVEKRSDGLRVDIAYGAAASANCGEAREDSFVVRIENDAVVHFAYAGASGAPATAVTASAPQGTASAPTPASASQDPTGAGEWSGEAELRDGRVTMTVIDGAVSLRVAYGGKVRESAGTIGSDGRYAASISIAGAYGTALVEVTGTFPNFTVKFFSGVNHDRDRSMILTFVRPTAAYASGASTPAATPIDWSGTWLGEAKFPDGSVRLDVVDGAVTTTVLVAGRSKESTAPLAADGSFATSITMANPFANGPLTVEVNGTFPTFTVSYNDNYKPTSPKTVTVARQ